VAASYVRWQFGDRGEEAAAAFGRIVEGSKLLSFKLARRKAFDPEPALASLAEAWDEGLTRVRTLA
jgi:hypothetical protein